MVGNPILLELEVASRRREQEIQERLRRRSLELASQAQPRPCPEPVVLSFRRRVGLRLVAAGERVAGPAPVPPCEAA